MRIRGSAGRPASDIARSSSTTIEAPSGRDASECRTNANHLPPLGTFFFRAWSPASSTSPTSTSAVLLPAEAA